MPPMHRALHPSLLLLPPAPSPPTFAALKAAYTSPLLTVLKELSRSPKRSQDPAVLDIALPCDHLYGSRDLPRSAVYGATQSLVAGLYKLICVIAAKESIDTEASEGVDARIILLSYPRNGKLIQSSGTTTTEENAHGPVIDIRTLTSCPKTWNSVYSVECEEGEQLLKNFLSLRPSESNVSRIRGGVAQVSASDGQDPPVVSQNALIKHLSVAVGGTFDHLHIGHKLLLTMFAFVLESSTSAEDARAEKCLTIGITGDELLKNKKFSAFLESWAARQQAVHNFLSSIMDFGQYDNSHIQVQEKTDPGPNGHAVHVTYPWNLIIKYVEIWDPFGPTITDESISALVISAETRGGGSAVNSKRAEQGWAPLEVFEVDVLDAGEEENVDETFQNKLSSTEIRRQHSERAERTR